MYSERGDLKEAGFPHSEICGSAPICRLPAAYRRLSRPSSPIIAKASTTCTYSLDPITLLPQKIEAPRGKVPQGITTLQVTLTLKFVHSDQIAPIEDTMQYITQLALAARARVYHHAPRRREQLYLLSHIVKER